MNVISRKTLVEFYERHPDAREPLQTWYRICRKAVWKNFNEVRVVYPSADVVGNERVIFNIKGKKYRLVARCSFRYKAIRVKWIGTHAKYDTIDVLKV
ncbi:MAG TPA: type II toxin-antitoxin system HigB family toxin [Cyclobacteriaceae bacterium]